MYDDEDIGGVCWFDLLYTFFFFLKAEDGIRDKLVTEVQTCALPICCVTGARPEMSVLCRCGSPPRNATSVFQRFGLRFTKKLHPARPDERCAKKSGAIFSPP